MFQDFLQQTLIQKVYNGLLYKIAISVEIPIEEKFDNRSIDKSNIRSNKEMCLWNIKCITNRNSNITCIEIDLFHFLAHQNQSKNHN